MAQLIVTNPQYVRASGIRDHDGLSAPQAAVSFESYGLHVDLSTIDPNTFFDLAAALSEAANDLSALLAKEPA